MLYIPITPYIFLRKMSNEIEIDKLLIQLQNNKEIIKKYEVTKIKYFALDKDYILEIKRKPKTPEQLYVYNPSVSMDHDYHLDFSFQINYQKGYMYNSITVHPVENGRFYNIGNSFHTQSTLTSEINISRIMDYIDQTEFEIINKKTYGTNTYFPSNSYICEKCKCEIKSTKFPR